MNKILILISLIISLSSVNLVKAQRYPIPVLPERNITIQSSAGARDLNSNQDTLWILKNSQFKNAIAKAKQLELAETQLERYKHNTKLYEQKSVEKDSLIATLTKDRDYYRNNLQECIQDVRQEAKRNKRKSLFTKIAIGGIPVAFLIGFFVAR